MFFNVLLTKLEVSVATKFFFDVSVGFFNNETGVTGIANMPTQLTLLTWLMCSMFEGSRVSVNKVSKV